MDNINISNLQATKLEELDFLADPEGYLQELSEHEESSIYGGNACREEGGRIICTV